MGINLVDQDEEPLTDLVFAEKDIYSTILVPTQHLPIVLQVENELETLTGLSDLVRELRTQLLDLDILSERYVTSRNSSLESRNIVLDKDTTQSLLDNKASVIGKYISSQVRIRLILDAISELADIQQADYSVIVKQLENWQSILDQLLPNLDKDNQLQELIEQDYLAQSRDRAELTRLKRLLSGERAGNDPTKVNALKERVINTLVGSTAPSKQVDVSRDLYQELWETASAVNDIRVINRLRTENIDLLAMREQVQVIKAQYAQDPGRVD